jgi:anti-sigma factor RsiW
VTPEPALTHTRAFELLPWLVNGSLTGTERDAVESHVRACITCRRELKQQQRLHSAVRARRSADVSAEAGLDRLDRELDETARSSRFWRGRYASATPFAVAAAAGLAVLAVLLWFTPLPQLGSANYSTLATAAASDVALIDIVFAEGATAAEMQALLNDIDGEIVAGPSQLGRYSVRLAEGRATSANVTELLETLGADPRVRFAGRSLAEPPP